MRAGYLAWPRSSFFVRFEYEPGERAAPHFTLSYSWAGAARVQVVPLASTPANLGGLRWWFVCPGCRRRAGTLHHPGGHSSFRCRSCHALAYESAQLSRSFVRRHFKGVAEACGVGYSEARDALRNQIGGRVHETKYLRC